ncbi:MAG TPA: ABC transporter permease subunit [Thermomicrobiales bacterium]|nr:ABC transporter permease subunit [Thermomicrobiales bacterium]
MAIQIARPAKLAPTVDSSAGFWRHSRRVLGRDWPIAYLFALPMVLLLFGLIGYPLIRALILSFYNVQGVTNRGWYGLTNYERLWNDFRFRDSVWITVKFATISVLFKFVIGLGAAHLLSYRGLRFRSIFTGLVLLPWIIPEVVAAFAWRGLYDPVFGGLNRLLLELGLIDTGISWLGDYNLALPSVIAVNVWKGIPFFTVIFFAGMKAIDRELYDAASVDGANPWQRFLVVTLPGLRYVIIVACLLSLIWTMNAFGLVYLLNGGGSGTRIFSILSYEYAIGQNRYSAGVAVAMAVVPGLLILIIILGRYLRGDVASAEPRTGTLGTIGWILGLPFRLAAGLLLVVVGIVLRPVEWAFSAVGRASHVVFVGDNIGREGAYRRSLRKVSSATVYALLGILLVFLLFPFYWVVITAFKSDTQIREFRSVFWPSPWTTDHFRYMLEETAFPRWFWNTVQVAVVSTAISVFVAAFGAYALVRLRWRGAGTMSTLILFAYLMPTVMLFLPLYRIFTDLHLINRLGVLMIAYPTFGLPFACWLLMGYYRSIPKELEEASLLDGANHLQTFWRVVLPLTLPALLTVALFAITSSWNEFLFAYVFVAPESSQTLPVGLGKMVIGDIFPFGNIFAASIMTAIPVVIIYALAQRFMVEGLTAGSVKG